MPRTPRPLRSFVSTLTVLATVLMPYAAFVPAAYAANSGFIAPDNTVADNNVSQPDKAWTSDDGYAVFNSSGDTADYSFPSFGIPAGATIDGIEVSVEGRTNLTPGRNFTARVWNASNSSPDAYTSSKTAIMPVGSTDSLVVVGGPTDKWGKSWSTSDFGESFKIRVGATTASNGINAFLDQVRVKVYYSQPDLVAVKTNDVEGEVVAGESFTWTIRVENIGGGTADFSFLEEVLRDNMPFGEGIADYGTATVSSSGTTGTIFCIQSGTDDENLLCRAGIGGFHMPAGSSLEISVEVNPLSVAVLSNPRSGGVCRVDYDTNVTEANEGNNDCSDSVVVSSSTPSPSVSPSVSPSPSPSVSPTATPTPPATITVKKVVLDGTPMAGQAFQFELTQGEEEPQTGEIVAPGMASFSFSVLFDDEEPVTVQLRETSMPILWSFVAASCVEEYGEGESAAGQSLEHGVTLDNVEPGDEFTCTFVDRRIGGGNSSPTGTLVLEKFIRGGSASFDQFTFDVYGGAMGAHGFFDESGRNTFEATPVGEYHVSEDSAEGYTVTYGDDCDVSGTISVVQHETATCRITNTADGWEEGDGEIGPEPTPTPDEDDDDNNGGGGSSPTTGTLIVQKVILFGEDASVSFSEFSFSIGSESAQFEEDGTNELTLDPGSYTVLEDLVAGYTVAYSGDCDANGNVIVAAGQTATCVVTNTLGVGGFNPGSEVPAPTPTPTPVPPAGGNEGGSDGVDGDALSNEAGDDADETPAPSASPSADELLTGAAIGDLAGPMCVPGGAAWALVNLAVYLILTLWLQRGTFSRTRSLVVLLVAALLLTGLASKCGNDPRWLPIALSVLSLFWLRLRGTK